MEFPEKCQAFIHAMYSNKVEDTQRIQRLMELCPDDRNNTLEWPEVQKEEIQEAIQTSSLKKAPEPDGISFAII